MLSCNRVLLRLLLAGFLCSLFTASGCDSQNPQPVAENIPPAEKPSGTTDGPASEQPSVDPAAINEEGLIVLQDEADGSSSSPGQVEPSLDRGDVSPKTTVPATPASVVQSSSTAAPTESRGNQVTATTPAQLPAKANVVTPEERNQSIATHWPEPQAVLFVSGQQHGYIEPCGCTGLENQKGGLIRRDTLLSQLRERGWEVVPLDVGNQVRRIGRQPELKFQTTVDAFKTMGYRAATLGNDDVKLSSIELIQLAGSDGLNESPFISANVSIVDPTFFPSLKIVEAGGRKIGITAILGTEFKGEIQSSDIEVLDPVEQLGPVMQQLEQEKCDFKVLLAHASLEESAEIARQVPGFDLVVTAGGYGEPTLNPEPIKGSQAVMVQVGTKGMYGGIVGLYDDPEQPIRYQKIAITSQFKDSERMLAQFALYQERLKEAGFEGLGLHPIAHPTGHKFVGSEVCGDCHTTAFDIWRDTPHVHATDDIVAPNNERGGIPRHHDPECVSCHATGWHPQNYYPYDSGFLDLEQSEHLTGSGCENCHGPGSQHVAAEYGDIDVDNDVLTQLREQMRLPLSEARNRCLECHDLDNSPDFHVEGAFDEYWEQVKHYGKD